MEIKSIVTEVGKACDPLPYSNPHNIFSHCFPRMSLYRIVAQSQCIHIFLKSCTSQPTQLSWKLSFIVFLNSMKQICY